MKDLTNTTLFLWVIIPLLMSFIMTLQSREGGSGFGHCNNWSKRIQLWLCILSATLINYTIMFLMMTLVFLTYK